MTKFIKGKLVVIIVAQDFEDIELIYPILQLSYVGAKVFIVPINEDIHSRPYV